LVLIVRGELIRKFPNALIYARPADLRRDEPYDYGTDVDPQNNYLDIDGDSNEPRAFLDTDPTKFKYPVFRAQIEPDTWLLGFDLSPMEAVGALVGEAATENNYPEQPSSEPGEELDYLGGYYFVFQEREGDIRFGLDTGTAPYDLQNWDDATWSKFNVTVPGQYLNPNQAPANEVNPSSSVDDSHDTILWGKSSADTAYILYQPPAWVAMHASRLLFGLYP
jgi:hypothetical protein